jgi:hypothetical protein
MGEVYYARDPQLDQPVAKRGSPQTKQQGAAR